MKKHIIYIATDANRCYLEVDYTQDLIATYYELQDTKVISYVSNTPKLSRIVWVEEFDNYEVAMARKKELILYTRMMKERLIRRQNPNWLSLIHITPIQHKKAVVYA